jgi:hypothetical protein
VEEFAWERVAYLEAHMCVTLHALTWSSFYSWSIILEGALVKIFHFLFWV